MFENGRRVALVFGLIALALAIWGYDEMKTRQRAQTELNNRYQQAFFEAVGHVENVEVLLTKGLVASSPGQLSSHLAELREDEHLLLPRGDDLADLAEPCELAAIGLAPPLVAQPL